MSNEVKVVWTPTDNPKPEKPTMDCSQFELGTVVLFKGRFWAAKSGDYGCYWGRSFKFWRNVDPNRGRGML